MQHHQIPLLDELPDTALIRQSQLLKWIPISSSSLWRQISAPDSSFPKPHKLSPGVTVWKVGEIREYIAKKFDNKIAVGGAVYGEQLQRRANCSKGKLA